MTATMTLPFYSQQRTNMIENQIRPDGVTDERVLDAFRAIPREDFIPEARRSMAYLGEDMPMGEGRFLLEPSAYARLLQKTPIRSESRVLDIGCLTGYSTALLNSLSSHVCGVDHSDWIMQARKIADSSGLAKPEFFIGELTEGVADKGPFDVIVINGAVQTVPDALTDQLAENGVIATFWRGTGALAQNQGCAVLFRKTANGLVMEKLFDAFVPLLQGFELEQGFTF